MVRPSTQKLVRPPEDASTFAPGATILGRYELLKPLKQGGMADLYLARAPGIAGFEKIVVLKRIQDELAEDDGYVRMFLHEARLAATLQHPNIVQVFDIGEVDGSYFFVMEYARGEDLHALIQAWQRRRGPVGLPLEVALAIGVGVAAGLHYAHEKRSIAGKPLGIVHRDVSPSNVIVTFDGGVKIVDFGIAKAKSQTSITPSGQIKGKLRYMSPEQCTGKSVDRRSDVFCLGILLHELTTGQPLYPGAADLGLFQKIVNEAAPHPTSKIRDYPVELERIVLKALERDPGRRYQTMDALEHDLLELARKSQWPISARTLNRLMTELFGAGGGGTWLDVMFPTRITDEDEATRLVHRLRVTGRRARRAWVVPVLAALLGGALLEHGHAPWPSPSAPSPAASPAPGWTQDVPVEEPALVSEPPPAPPPPRVEPDAAAVPEERPVRARKARVKEPAPSGPSSRIDLDEMDELLP